VNVGRQSVGLPCFHSATPAGIVELLRRHGITTAGKSVVVVGRSNIVGKPLAAMLMQKGPQADATVTVCHSATPNLADVTRRADILVAALGRPGCGTADMGADGAVVVDVGTTRVPDASRKSGFRLSGDVDFDNVAPKCAAITPVPGGVGPMTIVSLMLNTLQAAKNRD
ncbi:MAG: bifunctional 5,10-methylene-tetrahydrofolate dehydrogenase/5,10-methylene-tetrahydrofolate cyclohydrolase, partial [Muribaculaceae bacterium]|nr:bifunctional 5,10-methylene-tetrahydrofolate dehydrogenase/5,10-methylene-tetrahydrofolate cyclohydrolase [Muribaculaceae bacterium]